MAPNFKISEKRKSSEFESTTKSSEENASSQARSTQYKRIQRTHSYNVRKSVIRRILVDNESRSQICNEYNLAESTLRGWLDSSLAQQILDEAGLSTPSKPSEKRRASSTTTTASRTAGSSPSPASFILSERFGPVANLPLNLLLGYCAKQLDRLLIDPSSIGTEKLTYLEQSLVRLQSTMSRNEVLELLEFLEDLNAAKIQQAAEATIKRHQRLQSESYSCI